MKIDQMREEDEELDKETELHFAASGSGGSGGSEEQGGS